MFHSLSRTICVLLLLIGTPAALGAGVLIVDPSGQAGTFADIQTACDTALDGDTVLVKSGSYPAFALVNRSLTVAADAGAFVQVHGVIRIRNLAASKTACIVGFFVHGQRSSLVADVLALLATGNQGSVRIASCTLSGANFDVGQSVYDGSDAVHVLDSVDVAFTRCTVYGGAGAYGGGLNLPGTGGIGMLVMNSSVAFYDGEVWGGPGASGIDINSPDGGSGNNAFEGIGSTIFASKTRFEGGNGGSGTSQQCYPSVGGNGGNCMEIGGGIARFVGVTTHAGQGGNPNQCGPPGGPPGHSGTDRLATGGGVFIDLPVQPRSTTYSPNPVRDNSNLVMTLTGSQGDRVALVIAPSTTSVFTPQWNGQQFFPAGYRLLRLTTLTGAGPQQHSLPMADLGPGVQSRTYFVQSLFRGVDGVFVLGSAAPLVVLDAAY